MSYQSFLDMAVEAFDLLKAEGKTRLILDGLGSFTSADSLVRRWEAADGGGRSLLEGYLQEAYGLLGKMAGV